MTESPGRGPDRPAPTPSTRAARFYLPRGHRLFAAFGDDRAVQGMLADIGPDGRRAWIFEGSAGAAELQPDTDRMVSRMFSWLFSHNVEYLRGLSRTVASGKVIVALPARSLRTAEGHALVVRRHGGEALAYTAHWNFVPLIG